jgi:hypothetical protein
MDAARLTRKYRTPLVRVIANCDHVIELLARELINGF